ncbi:MAG: hypothetical protein AB1472_00200 [Candidatus Omnitrophota bacterium]
MPTYLLKIFFLTVIMLIIVNSLAVSRSETLPRIYHTEFENNFEQRIQINHQPLNINVPEKQFSPNKAHWFVLSLPDYLKDDPWSTTLKIYNEKDYLIQIKLIDHNNYAPKAKWINEKLLYIEVWWGRIKGSYLIFDVEKEKVISKEMLIERRQNE